MMNFDFRKPEISFKRVIAMLLAVVMCAGQVNIDVLAKAVIRADGKLVESGEFQNGDVSGDASGNAWYEVPIGGSVKFYYSDAIDRVELETYQEENWIPWDMYEVYNSDDFTVKLYKGEELLGMVGIGEPYTYKSIQETDFNSFYYKVYYAEQEIGVVNCKIRQGLAWDVCIEKNDFYLLPGESAELKVAVEASNEDVPIDKENFQYQWQKYTITDEGDEKYEVIEETSSTYQVKYEDCGEYVCIVSDGKGNTKSISFEVNRDSGLVVEAVDNSAKYVKSGEGTELQVNAYSKIQGVTIISYQWYKEIDIDENEENEDYEDRGLIEGAINDSLVIDNVTEDQEYFCEVTDSNGETQRKYFGVYLQKQFDSEYTIKETELKLNQSVEVDAWEQKYFAYPFTPTITGKYTFHSTEGLYVFGYLLDANGVIIAAGDNVGEDYADFKLNAKLTGRETYYLVVSNYLAVGATLKINITTECAAHTETVIKNAKEATCEEEGYTGDAYCINCGELVSSGETIDYKGHSYDSGRITTAATCVKEGVKTYTCTVCGATKTESIAATGVHSYGGWTMTKAATVLAKGEETRTCSVCGAKETREIAKKTATISVNYKTIPLAVKQSTTAVKITYTKGDGIASWKSSNKKVATVTSKGKITGKKKGTATITVTLKSGKTATITVKVQKKAVATTKVAVNSKSVKLKKGKKFQIKATVTPVTSKQKVTYKTSNKKIATVTSKGKITAKKKGKATITVTSGKKSVKVKVTVK